MAIQRWKPAYVTADATLSNGPCVVTAILTAGGANASLALYDQATGALADSARRLRVNALANGQGDILVETQFSTGLRAEISGNGAHAMVFIKPDGK